MLDQEEEEGKEKVTEVSKRVQEAVHREDVAFEKLKAANTAKAEAAAETLKAASGRGEVEKTVKVLELHMEGNQKLLELEQKKKEASEALEAAKKAAEEAKKREKELAEESKAALHEQKIKASETLKSKAFELLESFNFAVLAVAMTLHEKKQLHLSPEKAANLEIGSEAAFPSSTSFTSSTSSRTFHEGPSSCSTWGRRNLEAELRQAQMELMKERERRERLAAELCGTKEHLRQVQAELDLQRDRDALLADFAEGPKGGRSMGLKMTQTPEEKEELNKKKVQERQEKKALAAELHQIDKMRHEREKERQQRLKQAAGKSKAKRAGDAAGLPAKAARVVRDLD
eukprot:symbB.v1.2.007622.t3/scaffold469.1/size203783/3